MCGRYVQTASTRALAARFGVAEVAEDDSAPDYNVAPSTAVPAVLERPTVGRVLESLRWGLVPSWAKDPSVGNRMINARAESLASKSAFKTAYSRRRCLLPADGFYEWKPIAGARRKQPMYVQRVDGTPIALAGLWERWRPRDTDEPWLVSCVIVTTAANAMMRPIHDRMPVMIAEDRWAEWLDPERDGAQVASLLAPVPDDVLVAHAVGLEVNNPRAHGAALVAPADPETLVTAAPPRATRGRGRRSAPATNQDMLVPPEAP